MSNQTKTEHMELLAPAGDWDSLLAGIAAGADAVYLGGKLFNARQNAANFDIQQLQEATDLLHLHGKKIYVTVNTLIGESELEEALNYLYQLYNIGVDAIIVQDLGLIKLAKDYLPGLELHASTQMTVHNLEGAIFLKNLGIKRVVPARELTKTEVAEIVANSGVEIEIFIHGALCISYSGQCLMSSMIGGRSGNRGRCAQPCRMEYQLGRERQIIPAKGSYLLSPKDLALITEIPELDRVGVSSLKIEGRMKRTEYVYHVLRIYRQVLDRYYNNPAAFKVAPEELRELEQSFNRGFTTGYFSGYRNYDLMSFARPNNRGVFLGRIIKADRSSQRISLKLEAKVETGDEVEVWVSQGGRATGPVNNLIKDGQTVGSAEADDTVSLEIPGKLFPGDRVFKVFSISQDRLVKEAVDQTGTGLKIACTVKVAGRNGTVLTLSYRDDIGNEGTAVTENKLQPARNRPLTLEILQEQLSRLGNTPYYLKELTADLEPNLMIPLSDLNQTRRLAIERLTGAKLKSYQKLPAKLEKVQLFHSINKRNKVLGRSNQLSVWVGDLAGVSAAVEAGADIIYAGGDELTGFHWEQNNFNTAIEVAHRGGARLVAGLPRINRTKDRERWLPYLEMVLGLKADGIIVSDLGMLQLATASSEKIYLNYTLNFFNSYALAEMNNLQVEQVALSPELTLDEIRVIAGHSPEAGLECLVQGPLELMISEYCPISSVLLPDRKCTNLCRHNSYFLRDRLNLDFPIYTDQYCRMHLLNARELCLLGDLDKFTGIPELTLRLELKTYSDFEIGQLVAFYKTVLNNLSMGKGLGETESKISEIKTLTGRGITKGHYFRGVE